MKSEVCIICSKPLKNGIMIKGKGICRCCEERLLSLEMNTDFYEHYKDCIKKQVTPLIMLGGENFEGVTTCRRDT